MMAQLERLAHRDFWLKCIAFALVVVYGGWNLVALSMSRVPESLLLAITGLPCPTSGGTRAVWCLFQGDVVGSLQWNPMAVPIVLLAAATVVRVAFLARSRSRISLSMVCVQCWLWTLTLAWLIQLSRYFTVGFPGPL